jgi:hypothetical protein
MCDKRAPCTYARGKLRKMKAGKLTNKEARALIVHFGKAQLSREFFAKRLEETRA